MIMQNDSNNNLPKFVFDRLIQQEGDYIGMIAYGLYKKNKIEYINDYKLKNKGERPSNDDLLRFQENHCLDRQLKLYRESAENITADFFELLIEDEYKKINKERESIKSEKITLEKRDSELKKKETEFKETEKLIKSRERNIKLREKYYNLKPNHWFKDFSYGVLQSVTASFIFIGLAILILFAIDNHIDLIEFFRNLWKK